MILHCFLVKKIAEKRLNFKYLYSVINIFHIRTQNLLPFFFLLLKKKGFKPSTCIFTIFTGKARNNVDPCVNWIPLFFLNSAEQVENECKWGRKAARVPQGSTGNVKNMLLVIFLLLYLVPINLQRIFFFQNSKLLQTSVNALCIIVLLNSYMVPFCFLKLST